MHIKNNILLAFEDVRCKPEKGLQIIKGMVFIMTIMMVSGIIMQIVENFYEQELRGDVYTNALMVELEIDKTGKWTEETAELLEKLEKLPYMAQAVISHEVNVCENTGNSDYAYISLKRVTMLADGHKYQGIDDKSNDFQSIIGRDSMPVKFEVRYCLMGSDLFSGEDLYAYTCEYPGRKLYLTGRAAVNENEMVMSDYMLKQFGIKDYNEMIGKKVTFFVDDVEYMKDYILVGVVSSDIYRIKECMLTPQIIITDTVEDGHTYGVEYCQWQGSLDDYSNSKLLYQYLDEECLLQDIHYNKDIANSFWYTKQIKSLVEKFMIFIVAIIFVAVLLSMQGILRSQIDGSLNYNGMLSAMGMKFSTLFVGFMFQQVIYMLGAWVGATLLSSLVMQIINTCLHVMLEGKFLVTFSELMQSITKMGTLTGVLLLVNSAIIFGLKMRKTIHDMLKA